MLFLSLFNGFFVMKNSMQTLVNIVQKVSHIKSATAQVTALVHAVCDAVDVDVCSLYGLDINGDMTLLASQGLTISHPITVPQGRGLVNVVATSKRPLNIEDAVLHSEYFYVALSKEENFHSFCGVPLVRRGEVVGVLVVQREQAAKLDADSEAFLVTLASHLAVVIPEEAFISSNKSAHNVRHRGISGAPGIAIGRLWHSEKIALEDVTETSTDDYSRELERWHTLLRDTKAGIKAEQAALGQQLSPVVTGIFDAYLMLLVDPMLIDKVASEVQRGAALPWALKLSINYFAELFQTMEDPYLRARAEDIAHLGNKLYQVWLNQSTLMPSSAATINAPIILAGKHITVSDIASVPKKYLAGIVCFDGSVLSHTAVLANALGIPAVMGLGEIDRLEMLDTLILDGNSGQLICRPSATVLEAYRKTITSNREIYQQLKELRNEPALTTDGCLVSLLSNTGLLADILPGLKNGAQGVGLYRTEIPFMIRQSFPSEQEQINVYREVCKAYKGKPVYFRTLDIGGDKQLPYFTISGEENPALGWRGIRFTLDNIQILMTQIRAIIRAAADDIDLHILIPMVSSTDELDQFRTLLDQAYAQLTEEGLNPAYPKIGVMVEVPAAISLLKYWRKKIDFISIGSNDLSQYLLALDRNNARVASRYDHVHPSIINEIFRVATMAQSMQIPLSVCGELASDPIAVLLLLGMGVRQLSMSSAKIPQIKWLIRSVSTEQTAGLLRQALELDNSKAIRSLGRQFIEDNQLTKFIDVNQTDTSDA
jgi:phosphoenolpyruvate-protein phosphotransferase